MCYKNPPVVLLQHALLFPAPALGVMIEMVAYNSDTMLKAQFLRTCLHRMDGFPDIRCPVCLDDLDENH
ncbi:hypothetical protein BU26DRAFT_517344 [Trematosphaeria pertusa]|uniref:Uncharacterized protein n=1 Tax=Trematosphaeria pertusa TaxID=390896 RepID=A0A6A6IJC4_9PLEO|nr:uncharacterized protein BU26DRAFT_517344 [Trematosphaeria pertusa]KAF2250511.1 hypothetical protein BU26DRAFT_517344 [Trematosphaeria pertusa]